MENLEFDNKSVMDTRYSSNMGLLKSLDSSLKYIKTPKYMPGYDIVFGVADSLEFLRGMPSNSVNLVVTSPPYNIGKVYEEKKDLDEYLDYQNKVAGECVRILKEDGSIAWETGNYIYDKEVYPLDAFFYQIFKNNFKLKLRNRVIWRFEHGLHAKLRFSGRYETILWFTKSDKYTFNLDSVRVPQKYPGKTYYKGDKRGQLSGNPLGKNPGDIWEIVTNDWESEIWDIPNVKANHPEKTIHPAQFPIELVQRLVLALTNEDDIVLDPYGGVGSTVLASVLCKRRAISIDKSEEYTEIAVKRLRDLVGGSLKVRKIGTEKYVPTGKEKTSKVPALWSYHGSS